MRNRMANNRNSNFGPFLLGALAGGIVGAAIGLLYAPAAGDETRREMSEKVDDITDTINRILHNAKSSADKMLNEGRARSEDLIGRTRERAEDLMDDANRAIDEARQRGSFSESGRMSASTRYGSESDGSLGSEGTNGGYPSGVDNSKL
jgi:gas vesicle protein